MRIFAALMGIVFSFNVFAAASNVLPSSSASVPAKINYLEGKHYIVLAEPVKPTDPSKIEVVEVFSYTCPHCMHFEPLVHAWAKKQPADVNFVQVHAMWNSQMEPYQRGFYTMVALKVKDKMQVPTFTAFNVERKELNNAQAWADFLSFYGIDKQAVLKTYDSFGVTSQVKQADARTRGYKVTGTPELVVDGKYRISSTTAGGHEEMLKVAQFIVDKIRSERAPR